MKPLVISFVVFVAVIFGVFLLAQQFLLALAWLCFAGLNAVVLRKLYLAPSYFEKIVLEGLERHEEPVPRDDLLQHFHTETPNLKPHETETVFLEALNRLEQRGLIRIVDGTVARRPRAS